MQHDYLSPYEVNELFCRAMDYSTSEREAIEKVNQYITSQAECADKEKKD